MKDSAAGTTGRIQDPKGQGDSAAQDAWPLLARVCSAASPGFPGDGRSTAAGKARGSTVQLPCRALLTKTEPPCSPSTSGPSGPRRLLLAIRCQSSGQPLPLVLAKLTYHNGRGDSAGIPLKTLSGEF